MNIRIQQEGAQGAGASDLSRSGAVSATTAPRAGFPGNAGSTFGDQVDISPLSGSIADELAAGAGSQSAKVQQLAALYASGHYDVDASRLSRALVAHALASSAQGGME